MAVNSIQRKMQNFEKLKVWEESVRLVEFSYLLHTLLPSFEVHGLGDQIRRASTSVAINIAEGSASDSRRDFIKFLGISRKSLVEVVAICKIINKLYPKLDVNPVLTQADLTGKILYGLIRSLKTVNG
ncbi:MAG: four helix bundle protein [Microgenomates group bacterium]